MSPAPSMDWPKQLQDYARRRAAALSDPDTAEHVAAIAQCHLPRSDDLIERAQRLQFTAPGLDETALAALESRLGATLPPSYRDFLRASDGLCSAFLMLLPGQEVGWLRDIDPETIDGWCDNDDEASDAEYAVYGPAQDCIHMRTRHLHNALQISTNIDGDVLLLIPDVRFGEEWEAWHLGAKNPGAYRYRSFTELFQEAVLPHADDDY